MRYGQHAAVSPVPHRLTQPSDASLADVTSTLTTPAPPADADHPRPTWGTAITRDRVGLAVLLVATAMLYLWRITINGHTQDGWSLPFYTAPKPLAEAA